MNATLLALAAAFATAGAQPARPKARRETAAELRAAAKITMDSARAVALARVRGGAVKDGELEREHGRLIYSFDITVPGKSGVEEVQVSALDGRVVSQAHESPGKEAAEARADARAARRGTATP